MKGFRRIASAGAVCLLSSALLLADQTAAFAYTTIEAKIPVDCLRIADDSRHIYAIKIESGNKYSPAPKSSLLEITENGTGRFQIDITEPGTYTYKVYEVAGNDPKIRYDSSVYIITLFVENTQGDFLSYAVSASVDGSDEKPEKIEFQDLVLGDTEHQTTEPVATTTAPATTAPATTTAPAETTGATGTTETNETAETNETTASLETVVSSDTTVSDTASDTTAETTTVTTTTVATAIPDDSSEDPTDPISEFLDNVLTGDNFPSHAVRITMLVALLGAISAFLFKRKTHEEENEDEK